MAYRLHYSDYTAPAGAPSPPTPDSVPGGPSFIGNPQPPDVPCDPTGDGWRGPPGPTGPVGPVGPMGPGGINVQDPAYGAIADGFDTGTAFTGTDNAPAFQAALNHASSIRQPLYVPPGIYRFQGVTLNDTAVLTLPGYCWIIGPGAIFLIDEDPSITNQPRRDFMHSTGFQTTLNRNALELCRIEGVTFQGRWSHAPLITDTDPGVKGHAFLSVANYKQVTVDSIRAFDCRSNFSRSFSCETFEFLNSHFERIAGDCLRAGDCNNVLIHGNFIKDTSDNAIATQSFVTNPALPSGTLTLTGPPRSNVIITNNRMVNCVVASILGPHTIIFSGNIMHRNHGSVTIGLQFAVGGVGTSTQTSITVTNNIISDCLQRYTGGGTFANQTRANGALELGASPATKDSSPVFPGEYDPAAHSVLGPWGNAASDGSGAANPVWGYLWTAGSGPVTGVIPNPQSNAGLYHLNCSGNTVVRTLPPVANFSAWGFGKLFMPTGYADPAIPDTAFRMSGIVLTADVRNFLVSNNIISGHRLGPGLYLNVGGTEQMTDQQFRGGIVKGNVFHDVGMGITTTQSPGTLPDINTDILIEGNLFDIDPYVKSSFRTVPIDGSWPSSSASTNWPTGINCNGLKGFTIRGNTFSNVYIAVSPTLPVAYSNAHLEDNLLCCDPAAVGWSASNRGIANIPPASAAFRHLIIDSNPTSATWRAVKNTIPQSANPMPSSGTYVTGQVVNNLSPTVAAGKVLVGWVRLTTGSAHVVGTDWSPLYCTVS